MRASRVTLLLAAGLLMAAELVAVTLLLRGMARHRADTTLTLLSRATPLIPRIVEWAAARGGRAGESLTDPWIEPFDRLTLEDPGRLDLTQQQRGRLREGELLVVSRPADPSLEMVGVRRIEGTEVAFRLTETSVDTDRLAADRVLIAQHILILLCALVGFVLAAFARSAPESEAAPTLRAYEEAMSRLRQRDDERLAAFDREKNRLSGILRDREAMARAGELTAGIVHEVRNSLGVIATQARLGEGSSDERTRSAAGAISAEVRTLQSVLARFLDFIKSERLQVGAFDLGRLVGRVAAREAGALHTRIQVEGAETRVQGDEDLLERAIENVVRNACQASGEAGLVTVKFGADDAQAFVIVEDSGPGLIDAERALRPFESDRPGGLGLGLPLVLKILNLHGGTFDLGPRAQGAGAQAVCRWPRMAADATPGNGPAPPVDGDDGASTGI